jgi:hypothetical protein
MERDDPSETEMSRAAPPARETSAGSTTCPTCGRQVEAGFKFCDFCGSKLETAPTPPADTSAAASPREDTGRSLLARLRRRRDDDDAASALAAQPRPADLMSPLPEAVEIDMPPERTATASGAAPARPEIDPPPARPTPTSTPPPSRPTSQLTKAEDLRAATSGGRAGISGRLQWRDDGTAKIDTPAEPVTTSWRAVPVATARRPFVPKDGVVFVLHLLIAFALGAALVGIAAVVASLMSDGRVALLEVRGLPIFIAGASSIIVFALLRTGPRNTLSSRAVAITVLVGFVLLVAGVTLGYQPSLMADAQGRLDKALGVFGSDVLEGIDRFEGDVDQWNAEVHQYSEVELSKLSKARDTEPDAAKLAKAEEAFRVAASGSEEALDGILKRMRSHADGVGHAPLREALTDLTGIFADELSGIHLITRGFVNDDQALIQSGDTRFKDATQRAVEFYEERVRPILERGDIDADSLGLAIEDLRG